MKVKINGETRDMRSVWMENDQLMFIDQRLLPHKLDFFLAQNVEDVAFAIKEMVVRGAPAIGAAAAYGMAQAKITGMDVREAAEKLRSTRPTAYDLFYAIDHMLGTIEEGVEPAEAAENYVDSILEKCKWIGEHGEALILDGAKILTHCNAGALATVDYGTALAPIRMAHGNGKNIFVFVDETRPRLQGARLTAWELANEDIPHALIADNAAGHFMQKGEIDLVIVGADRITKNGDAANKIGTYEKAVLAKENNIPFYVAAPISTFDMSIEDGTEIPIEERSKEEVLRIRGNEIAPKQTQVKNPAFDVTPGKYITMFITEYGLIKPGEIHALIK
ncbi:MAG: S-methyl-5-thioribose-1-phosphate isomerase [Thermoplasmata archaeon]|nr:MAG: S-methyl-5-thioribose-1-phosphate isomerase [Thermoplasmata archaeon]